MLESGVGLSTDTDSELIAQSIGKAIAVNMQSRKQKAAGDIAEVKASLLHTGSENYDYY